VGVKYSTRKVFRDLSRPQDRRIRSEKHTPQRRFPPPWTVEELDACFVVRDHNEQTLAYIYFEDEPPSPAMSVSLAVGRLSVGAALVK
jgi:hypothetical protein